MLKIDCSNCGRGVSSNAFKCPYCGEFNVKALIRYGFAILYVILVTIVYYWWMRKQ
jgi:hypothetical protein